MQDNYYQLRINQAIRYLNEHLTEEVSVEQLAKAAHFSTFHFQRIYKYLQGESPYETLIRLRLERAASILKYNNADSIAFIARACGFASPEHFSRQFKDRYGVTPSSLRNEPELLNSRMYQEKFQSPYYPRGDEKIETENWNFEVVIEELDDIPVYLIRAIFGKDGSILVQRYTELIEWAESQGVPYQGPMTRFGMSIDSMDITPAPLYRYDYAITASANASLTGLIEKSSIPGGLYATVHCQGDLSKVAAAWSYLYQDWLPLSGYVPRHHPALEEFLQGPEDIGWTQFNLNCRIPISKLEKET